MQRLNAIVAIAAFNEIRIRHIDLPAVLEIHMHDAVARERAASAVLAAIFI
jgi:hypothetical protein